MTITSLASLHLIVILYIRPTFYVKFLLRFSRPRTFVICTVNSNYTCTGFVSRSAYPSSLPSWFTSASVDLDRPTWPTPFSRSPGFPVNDACGHRRPRHWMSRLRNCPLSATERFPSPRHEHGTVYQRKWRHQIPCKPSKSN